MEDDELESGPKAWRRCQNPFVGLGDLGIYRECFTRSVAIESRLHNRNYSPVHKLPPQTKQERERFAHETAKLLMAIAGPAVSAGTAPTKAGAAG